MKLLWPAGIVFLAVVFLALLRPPDSAVSRLTNLDLSESEFSDTYLMFSKSEEDKAYIVDRRDSTMRRSNKKQPGRKWDRFRIPGTEENSFTDSWVVKSKRKGKGTVLFIPALDIPDWSYPFLYDFVAKKNEQLDLPSMNWTQIYVNRIYQGLFLRISLPFDLRKKDGGSGVLREIISVKDNRSYHVNTRLESVPGLYAEKVTESFFPKLTDHSPELRWLTSLNMNDMTTLVMANVEPFSVSYWPVPVNLPEIYESLSGELPSGYLDERFMTWVPSEEQASFPFDKDVMQEMQTAYSSYMVSLASAIQANAELKGNDVDYKLAFERRQFAAQQLGLELEPT